MKVRQTHALSIKCANHFGNIEINATIEELKELGINFGDSVSIEFSNGFFYHDIPYYNSFLGPGDKPCLYGITEAYKYVGIGYPVTGNPWNECGVSEEDYAIIYLSQKGKFADELKAYGMTIQSVSMPNTTTAEYANFRPLAVQRKNSNIFYRCANPIRTDTHCAQQAKEELEKLSPNFIINLSDTYERIDLYCKAHPESHYAKLRKNNAIIAPLLEVDFKSPSCSQKIAHALTELARYPQPYLIHCRYGVDRTGFFCVLLEALAGTTPQEIALDYMTSYKNIFGISDESEKYQAIQKRRFGEIESYLSSLSDLSLANAENALRDGSTRYLLDGGMSNIAIEKIIKAVNNSKL